MHERETVEELQDVLLRNGFVRCDIAACNCGSWHARFGLPERWDEVKAALAEAGYPLCNENGHLVSKALKALIDERDRLKDVTPNTSSLTILLPPLTIPNNAVDKNGP